MLHIKWSFHIHDQYGIAVLIHALLDGGCVVYRYISWSWGKQNIVNNKIGHFYVWVYQMICISDHFGFGEF